MTDALAASLTHSAQALHSDLLAGTWTPSPQERLLAECVAYTDWTEHSPRTALRDIPDHVRSGHLVAVLHPAIQVAENIGTPASDTALQKLRALIGAVAPDIW
ncbi:hypothetical protein G6045_08835 [Streptomyces sp. YC504]|uniref:Uncharacterized protein n=1 Tax=Streptomyces mesophilus TaxID=1775132 RepID=A0A6G4XG21_9ACTN|nr:hypothetical protein [Streptomyces mesophilus]NGO75777.1 hypothetical protein [Streptomyces mesophilus]